jgi:hypothetical protein
MFLSNDGRIFVIFIKTPENQGFSPVSSVDKPVESVDNFPQKVKNPGFCKILC